MVIFVEGKKKGVNFVVYYICYFVSCFEYSCK